MRRHLTTIMIGLVVLIAGSFARAETKLSVDIGWTGKIRANRWIPIFVTASDTKSRNVILTIHWPHGGNFSMDIEQAFAIGPNPQTFPLLLPTRGYAYSFQNAVYTLRDADTQKALAHFPEPDSLALASEMSNVLQATGSLVAVSGRQTHLESLQSVAPENVLTIGYLPSNFLPSAGIGYDAIDLLVLNQPNLNPVAGGTEPAIDPTQQQAIVDWVRAGGNLLIWPSDNGFPSRSPLAEVLPCHTGDRINLELTPAELKKAGLSKRFARMSAFKLVPENGAQEIKLFGGQTSAYSKELGLGRIIVAPVNVAGLQFDTIDQARPFWATLTAGTGVKMTQAEINAAQVKSTPWTYSSEDDSQNTAEVKVADRLGDVPGAGQFGFFYVAGVMALMMFVVGPLDWFVLRRLGRQPWTWATTTGWIALISFAAIFVGYLFKSGDLHYRTLRLEYQVGDMTIAGSDIVAIYSPHTEDYALQAAPDQWWQPAATPNYSGGGMTIDVPFHQTYQGNVPRAMRVNVWSTRFLREDHLTPGPPIVAASLTVSADKKRVTGVIKNLTDRPLINIRIRTVLGNGRFVLKRESPTTAPATNPAESLETNQIPPYTTVRVEASLDPRDVSSYPTNNLDPSGLAVPIHDLDMRLSKRLDEMVQREHLACIDLTVDNPAPAVPLEGHPEAKQQHWQYVRALVDLKTEP